MPQPDPTIDTSRIDEIPAKEPKFNARPLKSALKKKSSGSGTPQSTPTQENRPLGMRQSEHNVTFKYVPNIFKISYLISPYLILLLLTEEGHRYGLGLEFGKYSLVKSPRLLIYYLHNNYLLHFIVANLVSLVLDYHVQWKIKKMPGPM